MASPNSSTRPQTEEMVIVHNVFRSNLEALPDLIRAADTNLYLAKGSGKNNIK